MNQLPIFVNLQGVKVVLVGDGDAALAKRRLIERSGGICVGEDGAEARIAIVADGDEATVARLKARGLLVNATDRPALCDFTLPAIVDRDPVLIAIGTGGASAGLAAALRQRIEALLPSRLGDLAQALSAARGRLRDLWPDAGARRQAIGKALAPGGAIDPLGFDPDIDVWLAEGPEADNGELYLVRLSSADPDDLSVRDARMLALADRIYHDASVAPAILDRARADAERIAADGPPERLETGLSLWVSSAAR